jgi:hypothetical protein
MDVSAPRLPQTAEPPAREGFALPVPTPTRTPPARPDAPEASAGAPPPPPGDAPRWVPRSVLKFTLTSADVDARFEIDSSNRVSVTMYARDTGEVIREIPSHRVTDVIAAIAGQGLSVDETR